MTKVEGYLYIDKQGQLVLQSPIEMSPSMVDKVVHLIVDSVIPGDTK